jgi:tetratricopeptide (TPR) repeat protein
MTQDSGGEAALVPVKSSALSPVHSASLAQRGALDFFAAGQAERCYREGEELTHRWELEDIEEAIVCFERGLHLNPGHTEMRFLLGWTQYCGLLLPPDYEQVLRPPNYKEAVENFNIAAGQGHAEAQSCLAHMYREGEGVDRNDQRAFFWREKAARQGRPCDQRQLGVMYEHGVGVDQDQQQAIFWYQKAADQGGYFERSEMTELQTRVTGHDGGWCKRVLDKEKLG